MPTSRDPVMTSYQRLLRDPRWQRRRLQILARDKWTCQECGATERELHVHHTLYVRGKMPWEVPMRSLVTLCVTCHRGHRRKKRS
jgi:5-methylcytosine-specific restriction endonuclease McrA